MVSRNKLNKARSHSAISGTESLPRASLRRLDWRFLLPYPHSGKFRHLILSGGPAGLAERIIAAEIAEEVTCDMRSPHGADALIVLHDSPHPWEPMVEKLAEGGVLYYEVQRSAAGLGTRTPRHIRRQLADAGLTLSSFYWAAPDFDHARRYVPLDGMGAVAWYFDALFVAGSPWYAAARRLLSMVVGTHDHRFAWFVPCLGIIATRGPAPALLPSVLAHPELRQHLPNDAVRPLLLTSGQDDASRMIVLPFAPHDARPPAVVIKLATQPAFNAETELEQSVQREVRDLVGETLRQSVPQPYGVYYDHNLAIGVERFAPGQTLWVSSGSWEVPARRKIADLALGAQWLTAFHAQTESCRAGWDQETMTRWIETPLHDYARLRDVSPAEATLFEKMRAHAQNLTGVAFPLVWQHHDFAPWNLYRDRDKLTVIDWEGNRTWEEMRAGPSLCDLVYFVTYWHSLVQRLATPEAEVGALRSLWIDTPTGNRYGDAAQRAVVRYMAARQLDWRWLPLLLTYTWIERVVYSHGRSEKLWGTVQRSPAAEKFAAYVTQLAHAAGDLFDPQYAGFWQEQYARSQDGAV